MSQSYICNTPKKIIGRSAVSLNAKKCPKFQVGDIIYLSNLERIVHSRWVVTKTSDKLVTIEKKPGTSISVSQDAVFPKIYTEKYSKLSEADSESLNKHFIHQMKVFPSYDYESKNEETNKVMTELKKLDPKLEAYPDAIYNDDILNGRLSEPYSVLIMDNFGVITFKCISEDPFIGDLNLKDNFQKQLQCNDIKEMLSSSPQLTNKDMQLTINNINAIIYETDDPAKMSRLNEAFIENNSNNRVFNCESFINFIKSISTENTIIDKIKRVGIIQSLLPKFINSKTVNIATEQLKFIPSDTFELDDIQKETLRSLDKRTYIKASAGSGKTILLLAKAYEVAVANPNKEFLLLCYNNKLAEDIRNQATNTGRIANNLRISTFDKFLQDENIPFRSDPNTTIWAARKKSFVELALNDKLNYSYGGIFVDEVQQMKEEWLCAMLKCIDDQKYMIVSGDYYQSINPSLTEEEEETDDDFIEEGDTSEYVIGDYTFETIVLDKNYRNTKSIAKVLGKMVSLIHKSAQELDIPNEEEKILGHAYKENVMTPLYLKTKSGQSEIHAIEKLVDKLINNYDCAPGEILIICPQNNNMTKNLVASLRRKYDVCNFTGSSNDKISTEGIKMGTIGRSIGLDFKAVILYGTNKLEKFLKEPSDYIEDISSLKKQSKNAKKKYLSTLRNIYVACSRAREILIVLDDSDPENLFTKFLKESGLEEV